MSTPLPTVVTTTAPPVEDAAELAALIGLRDAARALLALEADARRPDAALVAARETAACRYADYVAQWGPLNRGELHEGPTDPHTGEPRLVWRRPNLGGFRSDPDYLTVLALEQYDATTGAASPAPILLRRVNGRPAPVARVANAQEALAVSLAEGGIDLHRIAELLGLPHIRDAVAALGDLAFQDPERGGEWVTARDYLSGDVRAKHALAQAAGPRYRRNVAALAQVIPDDLGPLDIAVALGAPWVSAEDIEAFVREVIGGRVRVWHLPSAALWRIVPLGKVPVAAWATWGTARANAYDLITAALNGRTPIVWDTEAEVGRRRRTRNVEQSLAAQQRLSELQERFSRWVWEDAQRCARLCTEYNRRFNTHRVTSYDGSQLTFPGLADGIELRPWQRSIIAQILSSPATLCGHAVGAGKTRAMVCTAMTARRLGLATKPLIAVPSHLVEQVAREARQTYPFGRFLVAGEDVVDGRPRDLLAARCATGDWDAVIVSHQMLTALPVSTRTELDWLQGRVDDLEAEIRGGRGGRYGRSELTRRIRVVRDRMDRVAARPEPAVCFEGLGVDLLLVDEAHYFKRLPVISRREGMTFGSSQRAADLMLKVRTLRERRGRLPSIALFTGTPWSNTIAETFVWQSFLQPEVLAEAGVESFDAWAAVFVDYESAVEVTPDGAGFRITTRPSRIRNVPELRAMFGRCADIVPGAALNLERPRRVEHTVVCRPGPGQLEYVGALGARADKLRREGRKPRPREDNMLTICTDGRRAALDPQLVGVREDSPKIEILADRVARIHLAHAYDAFPASDVPGVFQLIFCDQGTPGVYGPQTYGRIKLALTARGVPSERIRFVHEANTPIARTELFAACRNGSVSVLIGSTDKVGVGTNVQARLRAIHHADAPWRPSDIEQREGRALRPGNLNDQVDIVRYVTEGTFDAYMWQTLQRKARFIEQLYRVDADAPGRTLDDLGEMVLSFAEVKALATGNPLLLDQAQAAAEVHRLLTLRSVDTQTVTAARTVAEQAEQERSTAMRRETMLHAARDRIDRHEQRAAQSTGPVQPTAAAEVRGLDEAADALRRRLLTDESTTESDVDRDPDADPDVDRDPDADTDVDRDPDADTDVDRDPDRDRDADRDADRGPEPVRAPWHGLGVELIPDGGWRAEHPSTITLRITLSHRRVDEVTIPAAAIRRGTASCRAAVSTALARWIARLDERIVETSREILAADDTAEQAWAVVRDHRFAQAEELSRARARLAEIDTALEASVDGASTA